MLQVHQPVAAGKKPRSSRRAPIASLLVNVLALGLRVTSDVAAARAGRLPVPRPDAPCSVHCGCDRSPDAPEVL
jgi:hypothetical protein